MTAARTAFVLAALLCAAPAAAVQTTARDSAAAASENARLNRLTFQLASELRCPMCQGQSIEESTSPVADEMKAFIRTKLAEGSTPDEVKEMLVASYGEWVLLEPRPTGFNLTVYILPVVVLLAGAAFVFHLTRRWTRGSGATGIPTDDEDPGLAAWDPADAPDASQPQRQER